ncbi:MAG: hypothetical protein H3C35_04275 [Bacteroidetes bacterium]|nr:hypothetical protein [Bacteroidota bacterium]
MRRFVLYSILCCWSFAAAQSFSSFRGNHPQFEQPIHQPVFLRVMNDSTRLLNINEDSLIAAQLSPVDTTIPQSKSTTIAMLSSMLLPGAGQLYNGSYWKAPIIWGLGYYYISVYRNQNTLYKEYRTRYDTTITVSNPQGNLSEKNVRDFYHKQRDNFGWYFAILYAVNILDAYVDAALYNFEVSPNLHGTTDFRATVRVPLR